MGDRGRVLSPLGLSNCGYVRGGSREWQSRVCRAWDSDHGPMSCCVPEPSGDGTWESDVMPYGGPNSYSYSYS